MNITSVTLSKIHVAGRKPRWQVRWHEDGKVKREKLTAYEAAAERVRVLRGEATRSAQVLSSATKEELDKLATIFLESKRLGLDLMDAFKNVDAAKTSSPALISVLDELIAVKTKAGRHRPYLVWLRYTLMEFVRGQEQIPIHKLGLPEVERFLDSKNLLSKANYRGRLSTLFNFAVRRGYIIKNPCLQLEPITVTRPEPAVLSVDETTKLLTWLWKNPRLLGWFVLATFAGLRPEEAEKTTWADVNFEEGWIRVQAQTTKTRQRRIIYPKPVVFAWLQVVRTLGPLPVSNRERRNLLKDHLRDVVGWPAWKQDVTRHTAASMWLAECGSTDTVSSALGHSNAILHGNYKALVTKTDAEKFWQLTPDFIKNLPKN